MDGSFIMGALFGLFILIVLGNRPKVVSKRKEKADKLEKELSAAQPKQESNTYIAKVRCKNCSEDLNAPIRKGVPILKVLDNIKCCECGSKGVVYILDCSKEDFPEESKKWENRQKELIKQFDANQIQNNKVKYLERCLDLDVK